jgi:exopolyphosphatase/guanosine-5'-triphosphate,3'-diphosphate pyrophosphatase
LPNAEKERAIHLELPIGRKSPGQFLRAPLELAVLERASRSDDSPERDAEIVQPVRLSGPEIFSSAEQSAAPHLPQRDGIGHGRAIIGKENRLPDSRQLHTAFIRRTVDEGTLSPVAKKLAAIDVGTNTIKVLVASVEEDGALEVLAREKEMVRLGTETLFTGRLSEEAIEAGVSAIEKLVKEARSAGAEEIRAVATCALREASNAREFQAAVLRRTGVSVDVISGEEEARLIHLAARSEFPLQLDPLLVLDIGGGSSELIVSRGERVLLSESIPMGVVRLAAGRSRTDPPNKDDIRRMKKAIRAVAHRAVEAVRRTGFRACAGSSGTIQSLSLVYEAAVRGREPRTAGHRTLTRDGLNKVNRILRTTTMREKLRVAGLDPKRRDISVPGGVLLAWILKNVGTDAIVVGERGLREGLLLDFVARHGRARFGTAGRDVRSRSVDRLLRRSNAETAHASAVARLALQIFDQTHSLHQLAAAEREWLQHGALLHDVGYAVGRAKHNRHSYYLITHGDLTGFAAEEIEVLASIARYHRGKSPKESHENWKALDPLLRPVVEKLSAILRIADAFDRSSEQLIVGVKCRVRGDRVEFEAAARADCEAELTAARKRANLFEKVFGRRAVFRAVSDEQREPLHQRNLEMASAEALWN